MRAFFDEGPDMVAAKIICLTVGVGLMVGGVLEGALHDLFRGVPMMLIGAYVTAASAVGLMRGAQAWRVFLPAGMTSFAAILGLAISSGALTS